MGMLTHDDLKQIGWLLDEKNAVLKVEMKEEIVTEVVGQVGEMLEENIMPHFDKIYGRFDGLDLRMDRLEGRMDSLERRVGRVDGKVNVLTNVLLAKRVINEDDKRQVLI